MTERRKIFSLILIMTTVAVTVATLAIWLLYNAAFEQERQRLVQTVKSQARLMEAVARFDAEHSTEEHPDDAAAATLSQIIEAHKNFEGFGETGEFALAQRKGDNIVFLSSGWRVRRKFFSPTPTPCSKSKTAPICKRMRPVTRPVIPVSRTPLSPAPGNSTV